MKLISLIILVFVLGVSPMFSQNVNISDPKFLEYLVFMGIDTNEDGEISYLEAEATTNLIVSNWEISDLSGIEAFINLENLECGMNQLTSLDVSACTKLNSLFCPNNQLSTLDLSKNTALTWLNCYNNQLTTLDVSENTKLDYIICKSNQLTSLDVSNNIALTEIDCGYNKILNLDFSKNTKLETIKCVSNQLTSLDVTNNTALTFLMCVNNQLSNLDVSKNTKLDYLGCGSNELTSLDVSKNYLLTGLDCSNNQLTSLNVSANNFLTGLGCGDNLIASLDLTNNSLLEVIELRRIPSLNQVCVWESPFPPNNESMFVDTDGSPNVYFTMVCEISPKIKVIFNGIEYSFEKKKSTPIPASKYVLAYHDNNQVEDQIGILEKISDVEGKVEFTIPENSNFTVFVETNGYDPYIFTDLDVSKSEEYDLYLKPLSSNIYIETPGLIKQLQTRGELCLGGYCSDFEVQPYQYANVHDYRDYLFEHYDANNYDYSVLQFYSIDDDINPALITRPRDKYFFGSSACEGLTFLASLALSYYPGLGFGQMFFPFCSIGQEPGYYINGRDISQLSAPIYTINPGGKYISSSPVSAKKANKLIGLKYTDSNGNITGSVYEGGNYSYDVYNAPGVYYSGNNSSPIVMFFEDNIQGSLVAYHSENSGQNIEIVQWTDSIYLTKPLIPINADSDSTVFDLSIDTITKYPIALIEISNDSISENEDLELNGTNSIDNLGEGIEYSWSEDGKILSSAISFISKFLPGEHTVVLKVTDKNKVNSFASKDFYVFPDSTSSNSNIYSRKISDSNFNIYPNPTNSLLTIETDQADHHSLEIVSLSGLLIYRTEMEGTSKQIDLTPFRKGIYFITVRSKEFVRTEKIIKL